jgi:hypothetical protein
MKRSFLGAGLAWVLASTAASAQAPPPANPPAPPPPPPWTSSSPPTTSTSGATLLPPPEPAPAPPPPPPPSLSPGDRAELEERIHLLEARVAAAESAVFGNPELAWLRRFHLSGFLQPQLLLQSYNAAASPNAVNGSPPPGIGANETVARSDGTTTNGDYFRLRRARLRTEFMPTDGTRLVFELDPTPPAGDVGAGVTTIVRTVEAQGIARWTSHLTTEIAAGVFKLPFGYEVLQSDADRPFIERSWGEQNMTPGEFDTGLRAYTTWSEEGQSAALQLALVNGQTEGEPTFSLDPDLNRAKDFVARLNVALLDWLDFGGSAYAGYGQVVDATALRFKQFGRWAVNGEAGVHATTDLGATRAYAEVTYAQNLDRGVHYAFALPAIPANISAPVTNLYERSVWIRVEQDLTHWVTLGARWDQYSPDTSQSNDARDTLGFVGAFHFNQWLQAMLEYDHAWDHVHAAGTAAPDGQIDVGSAVLQARF